VLVSNDSPKPQRLLGRAGTYRSAGVAPLFTEIGFTETPDSDEKTMRTQIRLLHQRVLGNVVADDGPEVEATSRLWKHLYAVGDDTAEAWKGATPPARSISSSTEHDGATMNRRASFSRPRWARQVWRCTSPLARASVSASDEVRLRVRAGRLGSDGKFRDRVLEHERRHGADGELIGRQLTFVVRIARR
jgi:hypothetical protein